MYISFQKAFSLKEMSEFQEIQSYKEMSEAQWWLVRSNR